MLPGGTQGFNEHSPKKIFISNIAQQITGSKAQKFLLCPICLSPCSRFLNRLHSKYSLQHTLIKAAFQDLTRPQIQELVFTNLEIRAALVFTSLVKFSLIRLVFTCKCKPLKQNMWKNSFIERQSIFLRICKSFTKAF